MPKCTGCGNESPANARFCAICGKPTVASPAASAPGARTPGVPSASPYTTLEPAPANNARKAAILGGTIVLLACGLLALKMSGVLGAKPTQAPNAAVLNAPTTQVAPAPVLNVAPVQAPNAPVIQAPGVPGNPMPEDIIAYLRWLKQFEGARQQLEAKETAQLQIVAVEATKEFMTGAQTLGTLDDDPTTGAAGGGNAPAKKGGLDFSQVDATVAQWNQVTGLFQQKTPPNPCAPLATSYNGALTEGVRQMASIATQFRSALSSLKGNNGQSTPDVTGVLTNLEGEKSSQAGSKSVDGMYSDADAALNTLRSQYTNIPSDIDGSHFSIKEQATGGGGMIPRNVGASGGDGY